MPLAPDPITRHGSTTCKRHAKAHVLSMYMFPPLPLPAHVVPDGKRAPAPGLPGGQEVGWHADVDTRPRQQRCGPVDLQGHVSGQTVRCEQFGSSEQWKGVHVGEGGTLDLPMHVLQKPIMFFLRYPSCQVHNDPTELQQNIGKLLF